MEIKTMIKNIKTLKNALTRISGETALTVITEAMEFGVDQLQQHKNASPLSVILLSVKGLSKRPKGFTQKSMLEWCESFGLEWNKKTDSFSIGKKAGDFSNMNPTFWVDLPEKPTKTKSNLEKALDAIKKLESGEMQALLDQLNLINMDQELAQAA